MKIIATNITNLTDARYFASWGVHYLAYDIDPNSENFTSQAQIKEISDWVEGPTSIITINGLSVPATIDDIVQNLNIYHAIIGPFIEKSDLPNGIKTIFKSCIVDELNSLSDIRDQHLIIVLSSPIKKLTSDQIKSIADISIRNSVYLDGIFTDKDLSIIQDMKVEGIVVKGGDEEKVGIKTFDELDDLLNAFMEINWIA
ncbi:MAG: hypothetical protein V3V14_14360 [Saprospiraceae bacterium]